MGFWNFLGSFAVVNVFCDLFSNIQNLYNNCIQCIQHHYLGYDNEDYIAYGSGSSDLDDYLEEIEDLKAEIEDLQDDLYDLELDSYPYDDYDY